MLQSVGLSCWVLHEHLRLSFSVCLNVELASSSHPKTLRWSPSGHSKNKGPTLSLTPFLLPEQQDDARMKPCRHWRHFVEKWDRAEPLKHPHWKHKYFTNTSACLSADVSLMIFALNQYSDIIIKKIDLKALFYDSNDPFLFPDAFKFIYTASIVFKNVFRRFPATRSLITHCWHHSNARTLNK